MNNKPNKKDIYELEREISKSMCFSAKKYIKKQNKQI